MLAVINVLGSMLMLFSITYALPMVTALVYRDGMLVDFVYAAAISVAVGAALFTVTRKHKRELRSRDGFLLVTLTWLLLPAFAALPLLWAMPGLSICSCSWQLFSKLRRMLPVYAVPIP